MLTEVKKDRFISIVNSIRPELNPNKMVKIKDYAHQVVIETENYFYKVYEDEIKTGIYKAEIRKKLAEVYQDYGIHWEVKTFIKGNFVYSVEEREKLKVCGNEINANDLFARYSFTLKDLEKKLRFPSIFDQIKESDKRFEDIYAMKLIRYCINKTNDYAYGHNGEIILLDDAEFFITFVDQHGTQIKISGLSLPLLTTAGKMLLQNDDEPDGRNDGIVIYNVNKLNCSTHFFFFIENDNSIENELPKLVSKVESMIEDNIRVLLTGNDNGIRLKYDVELNDEIKQLISENNRDNLYLE